VFMLQLGLGKTQTKTAQDEVLKKMWKPTDKKAKKKGKFKNVTYFLSLCQQHLPIEEHTFMSESESEHSEKATVDDDKRENDRQRLMSALDDLSAPPLVVETNSAAEIEVIRAQISQASAEVELFRTIYKQPTIGIS